MKHKNETADALGRGIWWKGLVDNFRVFPSHALPPGAVFGVRFRSFSFHPVTHMKWILSEVERLAAENKCQLTVIERKAAGIVEAVRAAEAESKGKVDAVVNCTGMGARWFSGVEDEEVFPVKGQAVVVRGEAERNRFREVGDGWVDAVIRRPGEGTVLGITKVEDDWSEGIEPEITKKILERCKDLAPELLNEDGEFDVIREMIGRRPTRETGVRIDTERLWIDGKERVICHQYGHSGGGFQNSVGSAEKAIQLMETALKNPTPLSFEARIGRSKL